MEISKFLPAFCFMMKYFFDIEKEITQQMLVSTHQRLLDCKEVIAGCYQVLVQHK